MYLHTSVFKCCAFAPHSLSEQEGSFQGSAKVHVMISKPVPEAVLYISFFIMFLEDQNACGKLSMCALCRLCDFKCTLASLRTTLYVSPLPLKGILHVDAVSIKTIETLLSGCALKSQREWRNLNPFNKYESDNTLKLLQLKCKQSRSCLILPALLRSWRPWWLEL